MISGWLDEIYISIYIDYAQGKAGITSFNFVSKTSQYHLIKGEGGEKFTKQCVNQHYIICRLDSLESFYPNWNVFK